MQAFKHSSLIKKATKDDDEPVPGYLFHEVKQATEASQEASKRIQDYILDRLDHKSPLVKWKALRVIKHTSDKGSVDFKHAMQRNQDKFRECAMYRGEPNPLHGDAFNLRVRETAADILNFLSQPDAHNAGSAFGQSKAGFSGGLGNESSNVAESGGGNWGSGGSSGGGGNWGSGGDSRINDYAPSSAPAGTKPNPECQNPKYGGFGNFLPDSQEQGPSVGDRASKIAAAAGDLFGKAKGIFSSGEKAQAASNYDEDRSGDWRNNYAGSNGSSGGYNPNAGGFNYEANSSQFSGGAYNAPVTAAPSFSEPPKSSKSNKKEKKAKKEKKEKKKKKKASSDESSSEDEAPAASPNVNRSGLAEAKVVDELCSAGGMRPLPTREQLSAFLSRSRNFDAETIGELLQAKLQQHDWKIKLKALAAIEAVAKDKQTQLAQFFVENCPDAIRHCLNDGQKTLQQQAQKTCQALKLETRMESGSDSEEEAQEEAKAKTGPLFPEASQPKEDKKSKKEKKEKKSSRKKKPKDDFEQEEEPQPTGGMFSGMKIEAGDASEEEPEPDVDLTPTQLEPEDDLLSMTAEVAPRPKQFDELEDLFAPPSADDKVNRVHKQQQPPQMSMDGSMPMGSMTGMGMMGGQGMGMGGIPSTSVQQTLTQQQMMQQQMMQQQYMMQQQMLMARQQQHIATQPSMTSNGLRFALGQEDPSKIAEEQRKKSSFNFIGEAVKREAGAPQ